ncbi:hypothetical protein D3C75_498440 [compost metagenome]
MLLRTLVVHTMLNVTWSAYCYSRCSLLLGVLDVTRDAQYYSECLLSLGCTVLLGLSKSLSDSRAVISAQTSLFISYRTPASLLVQNAPIRSHFTRNSAPPVRNYPQKALNRQIAASESESTTPASQPARNRLTTVLPQPPNYRSPAAALLPLTPPYCRNKHYSTNNVRLLNHSIAHQARLIESRLCG